MINSKMFSSDSLHVNYTGFLFLQQSPTRDQSTHSSVPLYTPKAHPPPSVFMPAHQGGDRLSPGSLDMRLTAELNRLEYMEESVRQLTDVERTRAVSLAQQETVSLAQILKVSASCEIHWRISSSPWPFFFRVFSKHYTPRKASLFTRKVSTVTFTEGGLALSWSLNDKIFNIW